MRSSRTADSVMGSSIFLGMGRPQRMGRRGLRPRFWREGIVGATSRRPAAALAAFFALALVALALAVFAAVRVAATFAAGTMGRPERRTLSPLISSSPLR